MEIKGRKRVLCACWRFGLLDKERSGTCILRVGGNLVIWIVRFDLYGVILSMEYETTD
jgi:hypothetical protein